MPSPNVLLLRTAGTNCDAELAHAFTVVGGKATTLHINTLLKDPAQLANYQILAFPGGFSYGDDIASGKILANQLIHHLQSPLRQFINDGNLVLGVCNGFQVLVKSGLVPGPMPQIAEDDWHPATLTYNTHGRFEDRWIKVKPVTKKSPWIPTDCPELDLPIAHGEGRFVARDPQLLQYLQDNDQIAFQYVDGSGNPATQFPDNPNGSALAIAGITDTTGRVLGLMPHPERIVSAHTHPLSTRGAGHPHGLVIFQSAIAHLHAHQTVAL